MVSSSVCFYKYLSEWNLWCQDEFQVQDFSFGIDCKGRKGVGGGGMMQTFWEIWLKAAWKLQTQHFLEKPLREHGKISPFLWYCRDSLIPHSPLPTKTVLGHFFTTQFPGVPRAQWRLHNFQKIFCLMLHFSKENNFKFDFSLHRHFL